MFSSEEIEKAKNLITQLGQLNLKQNSKGNYSRKEKIRTPEVRKKKKKTARVMSVTELVV